MKLRKELVELQVLVPQLEKSKEFFSGDAVGEAMSNNSQLSASLQKTFLKVHDLLDARFASATVLIKKHAEKQKASAKAMRANLEAEDVKVDELIEKVEKMIAEVEADPRGMSLKEMKKQVAETELFLVQPTHSKTHFRMGICDVMKWDHERVTKVLSGYLIDEDVTWDPAKREQLLNEISIAKQRMADSKEAIEILLEVKDNEEAAIYQDEHDKYLHLAADCQRRLVIW